MSLAAFLTPAETKILVLLSALVEKFGVSHMRDVSLCIYHGIHSIPLTGKLYNHGQQIQLSRDQMAEPNF